MLAMVDRALACSAAGSPETVRRGLAAFIAAHAPDEIILTGQIHDHGARLNSFRIAAEALREPVAG
jgi:alkanesulfonate monooxygenase SsuD/methylene tetrahydromethanopterin reductase-like flavin-dependent oxidoreductase (luciferase family)